jgi:phospholipid transport system substrate-binding protein
MKWLSFLGVFFGLIMPFSVHATTTPTDVIKTHVTQLLEVLRNPDLQGENGKKIKEQKVEETADTLFDFVELSKRSLGQNWNKLAMDQRKEFVPLYKSLLKSAYSGRITGYSDERIVFGKEIPLTDKTAEVQTTLETKTQDISICYRLIQKENQWKVYDVVIEGVSLINNYRSQFREVLGNGSPEDLIETLRKKVQQQ